MTKWWGSLNSKSYDWKNNDKKILHAPFSNSPISGLMMQGVSQVTNTSLENTLGDHYVRLNATLDHPIPLDEVSDTEIAELERVALDYVKRNPNQIQRAAKLMLQ